MYYTKFTLKDFRCFLKEQTLLFAKPNGKVGSGITYIVGQNNSGKTTILEGLMMSEKSSIRSSEVQNGRVPEFVLYDDEHIIKQKLQLTRPGSYTLKADPKISNDVHLFETIFSRRACNSKVNSELNTNQIIDNTKRGRLRGDQSVKTADILADVEKDDQKYEKFTMLVQRVIPEFTRWTVAYEDHRYIEYTSGDGARHKTDFLGDGVISVIRVLAHLFNESSSGLIIDEPELSLHPLAQKNLVKIIAEYSQKRQIIISTHSPYFISWEYIEHGAILNKIAKVSDSFSEVKTMGNFNKYSKLINGGNWQQPYLMDIVSKEIFFQDNILFLEGQEDIGLLREQFAAEDVNLFGYGVRGTGSFELSLELAKDLGIKKVCVLMDSGRDEDKIREILEEKYSSFRYKIVQWEKLDIRDKPSLICKACLPKLQSSEDGLCKDCLKLRSSKDGYFDKDGNLKPKEKDGFNSKINEIKQYFSEKNTNNDLKGG